MDGLIRRTMLGSTPTIPIWRGLAALHVTNMGTNMTNMSTNLPIMGKY